MARALPQPGEIIAEKYLVTGLIGRGGMGAVYVVEHRVTGKRLAVKCLLPEHSDQPELVERFLREAQAAGRIQHRYVVDVFDVGRDGDLLYIVMELIDGRQLGDLLRDTQLSAEHILVILLRAMEGVAAAHAEGIVHRDLKPENILICRGPTGKFDDPRVLDFGISKLEEDAGRSLTQSGVMMGTPYYMSFEQINSQRDLDQRVDVYAMGVILYEALSGRVPYVAESVGALAIRMMSGPPDSLATLCPDLSPALVDVVMRSIALERDQRYPTMQALIDALNEFVEPDLSLTPASRSAAARFGRSAVASREVEQPRAALRLDVGDAQTLRATPTRGDGKLRVDEDDESARPTTGAHDFPLGKVVAAALGVLAATVIGIAIWRGGAADVAEPTVGAPPLAVPSSAEAPSAPQAVVPASAEPLKGAEVSADPSPTAEPAATPPESTALDQESGPAQKAKAKGKNHKHPALTLDQMVPKAPALPESEREPEASPPAEAPPSEAPAPVAAPTPEPQPGPAQ